MMDYQTIRPEAIRTAGGVVWWGDRYGPVCLYLLVAALLDRLLCQPLIERWRSESSSWRKITRTVSDYRL